MGGGGLLRLNKGDDGATMGVDLWSHSAWNPVRGAGGEAAPFAANTK
jgi:hypothetical protein